MKPKILYVEDDNDVATIVIMSLQVVGGFETAHLSSGIEALELLPKFKPDLILLDVMMPEIDGLELFQRMKEIPEGKNVPYIFLTARVQDDEVRSYYDLGARAVIAKPFDPRAMCERIEDILYEHKLR